MAVTGSPRCHQCDRFHKAHSQLRFPQNGRLGMESWECRGSAWNGRFRDGRPIGGTPEIGRFPPVRSAVRFADSECRDLVVS